MCALLALLLIPQELKGKTAESLAAPGTPKTPKRKREASDSPRRLSTKQPNPRA